MGIPLPISSAYIIFNMQIGSYLDRSSVILKITKKIFFWLHFSNKCPFYFIGGIYPLYLGNYSSELYYQHSTVKDGKLTCEQKRILLSKIIFDNIPILNYQTIFSCSVRIGDKLFQNFSNCAMLNRLPPPDR